MPDLDIPGLSSARAALTKLSKTRGEMLGWGRSEIRMGIVRELYTEIRAARIAGHSWMKIAEIFDSTLMTPISYNTLRRYFTELDREYERETGVAALPVREGPRKKKGRPRKEISEG